MIQSSRDDLSLEATHTIDTLFHLETGYFFTWQLAARTTDRWELSYRFLFFRIHPCSFPRAVQKDVFISNILIQRPLSAISTNRTRKE